MEKMTDKKQKMLVSFSGGETSAYMCNFLIKNYSEKFDLFFVYANTGKELEETLIFTEKCNQYFNLNLTYVESVTNPVNRKGVKAIIVNFENADRLGITFENSIKKHGLPNVANPYCSNQLKTQPIRAYCRDYLGLKKKEYKIAIGIRGDEIDRVNSNRKEKQFIYPLVEFERITKPQINRFWEQMPFRLNLKSYQGNCDLCFKKSDRKLLTIANENPELTNWWELMERRYENFVPQTRINGNYKFPIKIFRNHKNINYFKNYKKYFDKARDEKFKTDFTPELFNNLDFSGSCENECLPFN